MSADKKSVKKKIETAILVLFTVLIVSFIVWTIYTMLNYMSTKMVYDLDEQEYAAICEEYFLDPQTADIEYIFSAGGDYYGVRLLLSENDLADMNVLFAERIFDDKNSDYFKVMENNGGTNIMSDGVKRTGYRLELPKPTSERPWYTFCWVFETDGKYYMEMNKQGTRNAKIYCKNIRS